MRILRAAVLSVMTALLTHAWLSAPAPLLAQDQIPEMIVTQDSGHDVSPPVSSLPVASTDYPPGPLDDRQDDPGDPPWIGTFGPRPGVEPAVDGATQTQYPDSDVVAGPGVSFPGISINAAGGGFVTPPDTVGAVGNGQYVQMVNLAFEIFDKTTGAPIAGPFLTKSLWTGFGGPCETLNSGDGIVLFDKIANRWVLSQFAISTATGTGAECIAVSVTPDATGPFNRYEFDYGQIVDYPKMGTWPDAYYVSYNTFSFASGNPFVGPKTCALQRSAMLNGLPASQVCFQLGTSYYTLQPVDFDGTVLPPAGRPGMYVSQDANFSPSNILNLFKFHVDFATPANSTITPQIITVPTYSDPCLNFFRGACIPQPGTPTLLESLTVHIMHSARYRNTGGRERLVATHTVMPASGPVAAVRWYEIRNPTSASPLVFQASTFSPDVNARWMPSIAMDKMGNISLGYSISNATDLFPSIRYTGRMGNELRNYMEVESNIFSGTGSATGAARWGDYSAMTVDPADDCTFYYTNEYIPVTNAGFWATRIAYFKFPNCTG